MPFKHLLATEIVTSIFTSFKSLGSTQWMSAYNCTVQHAVCIWPCLDALQLWCNANVWELWRPKCITRMLQSTFLIMLKCTMQETELKTMCDLRLHFNHMVYKFKSMFSSNRNNKKYFRRIGSTSAAKSCLIYLDAF